MLPGRGGRWLGSSDGYSGMVSSTPQYRYPKEAAGMDLCHYNWLCFLTEAAPNMPNPDSHWKWGGLRMSSDKEGNAGKVTG